MVVKLFSRFPYKGKNLLKINKRHPGTRRLPDVSTVVLPVILDNAAEVVLDQRPIKAECQYRCRQRQRLGYQGRQGQ